MLTVWAGEVVYEDALRWQHQLADARRADAIGDVLLTLTHDRVYTAGRHADVAAHVLRTPGTRDIRVVPIDRGGDVTYHGPGQVVAYPILKLADRKAARAHVAALEEACVRTAASFGITAAPDPDRPGVWVDRRDGSGLEDKLAAVGVRLADGVTLHGLAFNVDPDLADFAGIVPCGIADGGVCSLASLGVDTTVEEVRRRLVAHLGDTLRRTIQRARPADLGLVAVA